MYAVSQDIATGRNTVRWESFTSYNMVSKMRYGNLTDTSNPTASTADRQLNFLHGPEHQRIKQQVSLSNNAPTSLHSGTTWYLHGDNNDLFYEKEIRYGGTIEHKHYLSAGGITFAIQTLREGTLNGKPQKTLNYLHHDHLGSTSAVTDETGTVIERMAYDPWGKRRFTNGTADTSDSIVPSSTDRGFTLHEHLDEMGIIHMNGRVYDPYTGRFMSADPFIQSPDNLQSYNRYAYVMNNPLNMTDPSGYFSLRKLFRAAVAIAVAYYTGQWVDNFVLSATCNPALASVAAGAAGGFAGGLAASGGNINAGLQGAFTGALFGAAGTVGNPNDNIRYAAHAAAGCVSAVAGGGKCGQGMTAAVFGKYTTNQIEGWGGANKNSVEWLIAKGVATSIAGGAGSVIAGGKFDNGAATAAMGYLYNYLGVLQRGAQLVQQAWGRLAMLTTSPIGQMLTEVGAAEINGGSIIGRSYGKLGTVVENFSGDISGVASVHFVDRAIERSISPAQILDTVKAPMVVLEQKGGGHLFLTNEAAVVLNKAGQLVTTYGKDNFDPAVKQVLGEKAISLIPRN